jgi:hypothetical protein
MPPTLLHESKYQSVAVFLLQQFCTVDVYRTMQKVWRKMPIAFSYEYTCPASFSNVPCRICARWSKLTTEKGYNEFIVQYLFLFGTILKGECLKIFYFRFFVNMFPPGPLINLFSSFNILTFCYGIRNKRCATAVHNQRRCKFIKVSIIDDRSCKFTIGVIFIHRLSDVVLISLVANLSPLFCWFLIEGAFTSVLTFNGTV